MDSRVLCAVNHFQVLRTIVRSVPVAMVDLLGWQKRPSKHLLGYETMLAHFSTVDG